MKQKILILAVLITIFIVCSGCSSPGNTPLATEKTTATMEATKITQSSTLSSTTPQAMRNDIDPNVLFRYFPATPPGWTMTNTYAAGIRNLPEVVRAERIYRNPSKPDSYIKMGVDCFPQETINKISVPSGCEGIVLEGYSGIVCNPNVSPAGEIDVKRCHITTVSGNINRAEYDRLIYSFDVKGLSSLITSASSSPTSPTVSQGTAGSQRPYLSPGAIILHFDEGSGTTAYDSSGHGNNGRIYGAAWIKGISGNALSFNGVNNFVELPRPGISDEFTIIAWVKTSSRSIQTIVGGGDGSVEKYHPTLGISYHRDNQAAGCVNRDGTYLTSLNTVNDGNWHQIAFSARRVGGNAANMKIYVDGHLMNEVNDPFPVQPWAEHLYVGKRANEWFFNGIIDEVEIYPRVLTADEVLTKFNSIS